MKIFIVCNTRNNKRYCQAKIFPVTLSIYGFIETYWIFLFCLNITKQNMIVNGHIKL